jgi:hypothetical protein
MQKKLKLAVIALCYAPLAFAQNTNNEGQTAKTMDESAFTFTEAQLGEDDNMSQNVTILNSNNNIYASEVGYLFSPMRFRYRAFSQKYNDVYINGAQMNDMESGQFRYSVVGGLNQQTRNVDFTLPFESSSFAMSGMAGSNNYDFRAGHMAAGNRITLSGANRNYTLRGMYTFATGLNNKGWAIAGNITYRWANQGYVEGTFYNALSYFFGVQKVWKNGHSLSLSTWGNPTERSSQGAATDESYWIANNNQYNPYWGYQNGHKRNSRVITDFAPTAMMTWDWDINKDMRLVTTLVGQYSKYKSTKLNYNNADNPQPDYWKNLPSSYYDVWDATDVNNRTVQGLADWNSAYDYLTESKANRQINWDRLYYSNRIASAQGADAMYYIQAKHIDAMMLALSSTLTTHVDKNKVWNLGFNLASNKGRHYQTLDDLLGASCMHNINTYAVGNYSPQSDEVQYDLNTMGPNHTGRLLYVGNKFGYDYDLLVHKGNFWTNYAVNTGIFHLMIAGKMGATDMRRHGNMRNGMFANNSFGKSGRAKFGEAGGKGSITANLGGGHVISIGAGYQWNAPLASTAFVSPEMNNDFVSNLKDEHVFSSEFSYQYQTSWLHANVNAYFSYLDHVTEWQNFYFDDINSFSYVSMTGIKKEYYGVEAGLDFKITPSFNVKTIGTLSEAKNINNAHVRYMSSTKATYTDETVYNKNMREAGTPLTAASVILSYHSGGWYLDLNCNYYDRIYLSYSPSYRYESSLTNRQRIQGDVYDNEGNFLPGALDQSKGHGGFMVDGSIGKSIYLKHGSLSINLMVTNILNNEKICTGGYEQSRSDYTSSDNIRAYRFSRNPKKYYAFGTNGMLNLAYKF